MRARPAMAAALAATVLAGGLTAGLLSPASAGDTAERKQRADASVQRLRADLAETSRELAGAVIKLRRARAELPGARAAVAAARGRLAAAKARDARLARELARARAEEQAAIRELARIVAEMERTRALLGGVARRAYQGGEVSRLAVVLDAESPDDLASRLVLVESVLRTENALFDRLDRARAIVAAKKALLQAKRERIAALKEEAERQLERTRALTRRALAAQARVEAIVAAAAAAAAQVEREQAAEEGRLARAEAEARRLQGILAARARAAKARSSRSAGRRAPAGSSSGGALARPIDGPVTSPFGMRVHPVTGVYKLHDGTDYGAGCGVPVRAAAGGTVVWATGQGAYGNQVAVDHGVVGGDNIVTSYSHLSGFAVGSGQGVSQGQVIGYVGTTGSSTGCHLHFMVYDDGTPVNPQNYV